MNLNTLNITFTLPKQNDYLTKDGKCKICGGKSFYAEVGGMGCSTCHRMFIPFEKMMAKIINKDENAAHNFDSSCRMGCADYCCVGFV